MSKHIGTAPNQSPDVEYDVIGDEPTVFCEDQQKELPESDCEFVGNSWYSKSFLKDLRLTSEEILNDASNLDEYVNKFFGGNDFDMKKISLKVGAIHFEMACLIDLFRKIEISPKEKKK